MMQRDEEHLLEAWLKYYGYLFGYECLEIFDNGSTLPSVIETLKRYELVGVTIHRGLNSREDFEQKGEHIQRLIKHWDRIYDYDFALPTDCDEFIALLGTNKLSLNRSSIHRHLDALVNAEHPVTIDFSLFNDPANAGWFYPEPFKKAFLPSGTLESLDHGFHNPTSIKVGPSIRSDFVYVHLHNKPFDSLVAFTNAKLAHHVALDDAAALSAYTGRGHHLIADLALTKEAYLRKCANRPTFVFHEFVSLFDALGINLEAVFGQPITASEFSTHRVDGYMVRNCPTAIFDPNSYASKNPDVARSQLNLMLHYLAFGYREGRQI